MIDVFSLDSYSGLLSRFLDAGYKVRDFSNADPYRAHLTLRHDIDMSPKMAVKMATVEKSLDCHSTYFVLLRSRIYNAMDDLNILALQNILALGHDVGLHFDAALYERSIDALEIAIEKESYILETLLGHRVTAVSFHRPSPVLQTLDRLNGFCPVGSDYLPIIC